MCASVFAKNIFRFLAANSVALLTATTSLLAADPADPALPPELKAELDALKNPVWQTSATVKAGAGYRENILLAAFDEKNRSFGEIGLEALAWHPSEGSWEWLGFLNGNVLRYLSPPTGAGGEQEWFGHAEGRWSPVRFARVSVTVQGYYQDTVIDLSPEQGVSLVSAIQVQGAMGTLASRWTLPAHFSVEPSVQWHRSDYRDYAGDYDEVRSGGRVEWKRAEWLGISAGWFQRERDYDERTQYTAGGRALPDTLLEFSQKEAELKVTSGWTAGGKWKVSATGTAMRNRDGASGYFDYDQRQLRGSLSWSRGPWTWSLGGAARNMEYLVQKVGTGINPPAREARYREGLARLERQIGRSWTVYGEGAWERNRSNEEEFNYLSKTARVGIQREF